MANTVTGSIVCRKEVEEDRGEDGEAVNNIDGGECARADHKAMSSGLSLSAVYFRRVGTNYGGEDCVVEFKGMSGTCVPGTSGGVV
jgi:hypothetical protein